MVSSAITVANQFLNLAERDANPLTNMQVQKLTYIAHGFYLAFIERPLFYETVEAWEWGPVVRTLYRALRQYGAGKVTEQIPELIAIKLGKNAGIIIEKVWRAYGNYTGFQLSNITHRPGSPWSQAREQMSNIIPNESIMAYYRRLLDERARSQHQPANIETE
jgi:uncharacterized phage-associated protein